MSLVSPHVYAWARAKHFGCHSVITLTALFIGNSFVPFFLILDLRSRDNLEPWPLMAFLPPEEIVYYHYQLKKDEQRGLQ